jgi:hypothetical protein
VPYGGYHPYPRRFGRATESNLEVIHKGLNAQMGTAYQPAANDPSSVVWIENMAVARAINASWDTNQRLANQSDPYRTTDMLPRWEKIMAVPRVHGRNDVERRHELGIRFMRIGEAVDHARIYADAERVLGDFFVSVEYIGKPIANVHVPDPSYPWGTVVPNVRWQSNIAHVLIRMRDVPGRSDAAFFEAAARLVPVMDAALPAWATWDYYRSPRVGTPVDVTDGPRGAGFYLDEPNLDVLAFGH